MIKTTNVKGKLNKFIKENTLMGQALITDPRILLQITYQIYQNPII